MTWRAWAADGKGTVEMNGKIWPGALKENDYYDQAKLTEFYRAGRSVREIMNLMGCAKDTVYVALRRTGTPLR